MPIKYQANFSEMQKKCPENYYQRLRTPGCLTMNKPFTPFSKGPNPAPVPPQPPALPLPFPNAPRAPRILPERPDDVPSLGPDVPSSPNVQEDHSTMEETAENTRLLAGTEGKASHVGDLPERVVELAKMTQGVYAANKSKMNGEENFMQQGKEYAAKNVPDWTINEEQSSSHAFLYQQGNKAVLAYRGSQMAEDWITNAAHGTGVTDSAPQQQAITAQEKKVVKYLEDKHGPDWRTVTDFTTTGHSKGGAHAIIGADRMEVKSVTHNPSIPRDRSRIVGKGTHETWSTTGDPLMALKTNVLNKSNYTHNTIESRTGDGTPLSEHSLNHFSDPPDEAPVTRRISVAPQIGMVGASLAAGQEADKMVDQVEKVMNINNIDPNLQHVIHGVISGIAVDVTAGKMGYQSTFKTKLRAALSGVGALVVAGNLDTALREAGFSQDAANTLASTSGGAAAAITDEVIDKIIKVFSNIGEAAGESFFRRLAMSSLKGAGIGAGLALFGDLLEELPGGKTIGEVVNAIGSGTATYVGVHQGYATARVVADQSLRIFRRFYTRATDVAESQGIEMTEPSEPVTEEPVTEEPTLEPTAEGEGIEMTPAQPEPVSEAVPPETEITEPTLEPTVEGEGIDMTPIEEPDVPILEPTPEAGGVELMDTAQISDIMESITAPAVESSALLESFSASQAIPIVGRVVDMVATAAALGVGTYDLVWIFQHPEQYNEEIKQFQSTMMSSAGGFVNQDLLNEVIQKDWEKKHPREAALNHWNKLTHPTTPAERDRSIKLLQTIIKTKAEHAGQTPSQYAASVLQAQAQAQKAHDQFEQVSKTNARKFGISKDLYQEYVQYASEHGDEEAQQQLTRRLHTRAMQMGFDNTEEYLLFEQGRLSMANAQAREVARATSEYKTAFEAQQAGYHNVDTYLHTNPNFTFDPANNEFTRATALNLTINQYLEYLHQRSGESSLKESLERAQDVVVEDKDDAARRTINDYVKAFGDSVQTKLVPEYMESIEAPDTDFDKPYRSTYQDLNPVVKDAYTEVASNSTELKVSE